MEFDNLFLFGSAEGPSSSPQIDEETRRGREQILVEECEQLALSRKIKRSPFIAIEGIDKVGKTTQFRKVVSRLNDSTQGTNYASFPRLHTPTGAIINQYLNHELVLDEAVIHHLFSANRWELRQQFLADLKSCTPVVVDRYVASGRAYTIAGGRFDLEWARQFDKGLIKPDLTIWLDGDARLLSTRPGYGMHHLENLPFQMRVQEAFEGLMEEGWVKVIVDGRSETEIFQEIWGYLRGLFSTFYQEDRALNFY